MNIEEIFTDGRNFESPKQLKINAEEALAAAKKIEAERRQKGAQYKKIDRRTYILKK